MLGSYVMHSPFRRPPQSFVGPLRSLQYTRSYLGVPESVSVAREHITQAVTDAQISEDVAYTAVLLLSELATNAVRHADTMQNRPRFTVSVRIRGHRRQVLRLEVVDHDPNRVPKLLSRTAAEELLMALCLDENAQSGRGLAMLVTMTARCGIEVTRESATKTVWGEIRLPEEDAKSPSPLVQGGAVASCSGSSTSAV
jgi:serine/threonine-protein kinase RsbW